MISLRIELEGLGADIGGHYNEVAVILAELAGRYIRNAPTDPWVNETKVLGLYGHVDQKARQRVGDFQNNPEVIGAPTFPPEPGVFTLYFSVDHLFNGNKIEQNKEIIRVLKLVSQKAMGGSFDQSTDATADPVDWGVLAVLDYKGESIGHMGYSDPKSEKADNSELPAAATPQP
jgi:hypothetical protein